jgi:hypothetical protein
VQDNDELDSLINDALGDYHNFLAGNNEDWLLTKLSLSLTGSSYQLPSDHWQTRGVDKSFGNGQFQPLRRSEWEDRRRNDLQEFQFFGQTDVNFPTWNIEADVLVFFPETTTPGDIRLTYIPSAQVLIDDADELNRFYTINAWDEWIVCSVAADILAKEESSNEYVLSKRGRLENVIKAAARRDKTGARQVSFVRSGHMQDLGRSSRTRIR